MGPDIPQINWFVLGGEAIGVALAIGGILLWQWWQGRRPDNTAEAKPKEAPKPNLKNRVWVVIHRDGQNVWIMWPKKEKSREQIITKPDGKIRSDGEPFKRELPRRVRTALKNEQAEIIEL